MWDFFKSYWIMCLSRWKSNLHYHMKGRSSLRPPLCPSSPMQSPLLLFSNLDYHRENHHVISKKCEISPKSKLSAKKTILLYNNEILRISVVSEWFFVFEKNRCNFHNNKKVILVFYTKLVTKLCWSNGRLLWLLTKFEIEFTFIKFPTYRVHPDLQNPY